MIIVGAQSGLKYSIVTLSDVPINTKPATSVRKILITDYEFRVLGCYRNNYTVPRGDHLFVLIMTWVINKQQTYYQNRKRNTMVSAGLI